MTAASSFTRPTARPTLLLTLSARSLNRTAMRTATSSNALGALAVTRGCFSWSDSQPAHLLKALGALAVAEQDILPSIG